MEDAVLDTPVDTGLEETPVESTETPVEATEQPQGLATEPGKAPLVETPAIKDGKFSPEIKAHLDKLKVENPAIAKQIRDALFQNAAIQKALPGGIKELNEMRALVEERGGRDGITGMAQELQNWTDFDAKYTSADPKSIDFLLTNADGSPNPELQRSFAQLMPVALQRFEQVDKGGYTGYMAQVFTSTMDAFRIPLVLERLQDFVADNPKAVEQIQKLSQFYSKMTELSQSKSEIKSPEEPKPDQRGSELDEREARLTRDEWGRESAQSQQAAFNGQFRELCAGRTPTDVQLAAIGELFETRFRKGLQERSGIGDLTHEQVLERYRTAKDKQGFMKYAEKLNRELVPLKLKQAFESVMPAKPGPKPPAPGTPRPPAGEAPSKGFVQVAKAPTLAEVDMRHPFNQGTANWSKGLAVLKDGKRVQFKR